jgi:hypothetical protein
MLTQAMKAPPNKPVINPKIIIVGFEACRLNRYDKIPKPATPVKLASKITMLYHAVLNPADHDFLYIPIKTAEETMPAAIIPSSIRTAMKIRATVTTKIIAIKKIAQSANINRNVSIDSSGAGNGSLRVS